MSIIISTKRNTENTGQTQDQTQDTRIAQALHHFSQKQGVQGEGNTYYNSIHICTVTYYIGSSKSKFLGTPMIEASHPSLLWAVAQQRPQCSVKGIQTLAGCLTVPMQEVDHQKLCVVHVLLTSLQHLTMLIIICLYHLKFQISSDHLTVLSVFSFFCKLGMFQNFQSQSCSLWHLRPEVL